MNPLANVAKAIADKIAMRKAKAAATYEDHVRRVARFEHGSGEAVDVEALAEFLDENEVDADEFAAAVAAEVRRLNDIDAAAKFDAHRAARRTAEANIARANAALEKAAAAHSAAMALQVTAASTAAAAECRALAAKMRVAISQKKFDADAANAARETIAAASSLSIQSRALATAAEANAFTGRAANVREVDARTASAVELETVAYDVSSTCARHDEVA